MNTKLVNLKNCPKRIDNGVYVRATLAAIGLIAGLMAPWAIFGHLRAEPTQAQYCLTEGYHFDAEVRDQVISQCLGKVTHASTAQPLSAS